MHMTIDNKMRKIYKSKVDAWLLAFVVGFTVIPVAPLLYIDFSTMAFCIVVAILVLVLSLLFSIRYIIEDEYLIVKYVFFLSERFRIDEIQSVSSTHTLLSAPAASLDRLEIQFRKSAIVISPQNKMDFIATIEALCPHKIRLSL